MTLNSNTRKIWQSIAIAANIVFAAGQNMEYETCTCANSLLRPGPIQGNVTSVVEFEGAKMTCCIILGSCKKGL